MPQNLGARTRAHARHSYAGSTNETSKHMSARTEEEEEELFFSSPSHSGSLSFGIGRDAASPTKKQRTESVEKLQTKFRPRDSGIVVYGEDSDDDFHYNSASAQLLTMSALRPSGSFNSIQSESDGTDGEALITPGVGPGPDSGWPIIGIVNHEDGSSDYDGTGPNAGVDAFILRTLAGGSKAAAPVPGEPQRIPGTPVKKVRTSHLMERPWQSAVASKIGFPEFDAPREGGGKDKKVKPRKSLPAAFPALTTGRVRKDAMAGSALHEDDDEEASPTLRKDPKYGSIGLGRPSAGPFPRTDSKSRARWLMRRSSSGAFSSGSETTTSRNATPTRLPAKGEHHQYLQWYDDRLTSLLSDWRLPAPQRSPLSKLVTDDFTCSQESTSTTATNSPTVEAAARHLPGRARPDKGLNSDIDTSPQKPIAHTTVSRPRSTIFAGSALRGRLSIPSGEERPGKFDREFVEIDELGRGEFGRVIKARYKESSDLVFAVKKSKRFEGIKHR